MLPILERLREEYLSHHHKKEDLFWEAKMGIAADPDKAHHDLAEAEIAMNRYLQDPTKLAEVRSFERDGDEEDRAILKGWSRLFAAHAIEDSAARKLSAQIVEKEAELQQKRGAMVLGYADPNTGEHVRASTNKLALMMRTHPEEAYRRAAYEGLRALEHMVLGAGFLDIVRMRNDLGKSLGYEDYYDWRVSVVEGIPKRAIFARLDDLAARTKERTTTSLAAFEKSHGAGALEPWNFGYLRSGALTKEMDPYFRFEDALERWVKSFHAMRVSFRSATLKLDLVDRAGKYENGFMHGPRVAGFSGNNKWTPAHINFTSNAVPGQSGSGYRAIETLFHEGGHAAHFANILAKAPCFAQEFAPTSVAYAETQSMFMDRLLGDADWRALYAKDMHGNAMPLELMERAFHEEHPFRGWEVRAMMTVPFAERALYEFSDRDLNPDNVLAMSRSVERDLQGLRAGTRPVLAVPHLLSGEASAYYHGYVLALMGVYQTRDFFLKRDGYITNNPRVGGDLADAYWASGNALTFDETLEKLTGRSLSADGLVAACNRTNEDGLAELRRLHQGAKDHVAPSDPIDLDASIEIVHGREVIASTAKDGWQGMCEKFAAWIGGLERESRTAK